MDSQKAQNIFASTSSTVILKRSSSSSNANPNLKESMNYKVLNETLLRKIQQLKKQLNDAEKGMDRLRAENMELREVNQKLISEGEEERINVIVNQRVQKKLAHFASIGQRTIQFLQNAGNDMTEAIKDIQVQADVNDPPTKRIRKKLSADPNLEKVEESPIRIASTSENNTITISDSGEEETTPKMENISTIDRKNKGRRSALLDFNSQIAAETPKVAPVVGSKRQPLFIKPETPKNNKKDRKNYQTPVVEKKDEPSCSTARPMRSARPKSLKEPSLGSKMRNPGKFDEPCPFISTSY
ncbi:unnamed protein product [Caenorhabditis angaria]|uniref:Shugoshin C-terminal domain-containing protein n=1 Tax=Caenorhabditis angaria TaxID=860376 RepID=A0A9P1N1R4_9PELO|nr:unnamed protein product [Caenorhabditis angaria]